MLWNCSSGLESHLLSIGLSESLEILVLTGSGSLTRSNYLIGLKTGSCVRAYTITQVISLLLGGLSPVCFFPHEDQFRQMSATQYAGDTLQKKSDGSSDVRSNVAASGE